MSLRRRNSSPPRAQRNAPLYVAPPLSAVAESGATTQSSPPPAAPSRARRWRSNSKASHTLVIYMRPVDALVGVAPHMLLVPDEHMDDALRHVLETAHRASSNTTLGDDDGARERYRKAAVALCDAHALLRQTGLARDPRTTKPLSAHPGALGRYRLLAPETRVTDARISHVYFVLGIVGV